MLLDSRAFRWFLIVLVVSGPAIASFALVKARFGADITDFVPAWNDEVSYWHQTRTLLDVGFRGGYYAYYEIPPAAQFSHFYTYGPWYSIIYAAFARIVGWNLYSAPIINLLLVGAALGIFCNLLRLNKRQLVLTGLLAVTFWPSMLYLVTNMQESLQQFLATLIVIIFYFAITNGQNTSRRTQITGVILLTVAAVLRLSWAILYLPFFVLTGSKTWRGWLLAAAKSALLTLASMWFASYVGAPGNNSIFKLLGNFGVSIGYGLQALWNYFYANWQLYFDPAKAPIDMLQTGQIVVLALLSLGIILWLLSRRGRAAHTQTTTLAESSFHAFNLIVIVFASLLLYLIGTWGDYRVIGLHLFVTLLLLIAFKRYWLVAVIIVTNLLCVGYFLDTYTGLIASKFTQDRARMAAFETTVQPYLRYDPTTDNAWCNTVLFHVTDYTAELSGIPGGIGLSFFVRPKDRRISFKSQYLLLDAESLKQMPERDEGMPTLEKLTDTPQGNTLFRNPASGCVKASKP